MISRREALKGAAVAGLWTACGAALRAFGARPEESRVLPPGARTWLDAHNCYPEQGAWADRIDRALGTGLPWTAIEQDVAWAPGPEESGGGRSVVSHEKTLRGDEPSLESHFFARVRPLLEQALAEGARDRWPLFVLHLDFKTNEAGHHRGLWDLLGRYERFLTTAEKPAAEGLVTPLRAGPLMVLTESGPGQEDAFSRDVPVGGRFRIFGTVPPPALSEEDAKQTHRFGPEVLIPSGATSYRRWANLSWESVERGGPDEAGEWTDADRARLGALVGRAHGLGLWLRFYTLNGHARSASQGWSRSYNFGSLEAARLRWRAAIEAGVEFPATDQYEAFAEELRLLGR